MEEIKVGEYVRTRGVIGKLVQIEYDMVDIYLKWYVLDIGKHQTSYVNKPYIEKHSLNIIDLIEVGDYVNGRKVFATDNRINDNGEKVILTENYDEWTDNGVISNKDIKSIVTKEAFKSVSYEV